MTAPPPPLSSLPQFSVRSPSSSTPSKPSQTSAASDPEASWILPPPLSTPLSSSSTPLPPLSAAIHSDPLPSRSFRKPGIFADMKSSAQWNLELEKALVEILLKHNTPYHRGQNGWNGEIWNMMVRIFHARHSHVKFSKYQLQEKEKEMKKECRMLREARKQSGVGWDEIRCMIQAEAHLWDELTTWTLLRAIITSHPLPSHHRLLVLHVPKQRQWKSTEDFLIFLLNRGYEASQGSTIWLLKNWMIMTSKEQLICIPSSFLVLSWSAIILSLAWFATT